MKKILVSGLVNIETSLRVESFQLSSVQVTYPFFGINSHVSGAGLSIAKAISLLGGKAVLVSMLGKDSSAGFISEELAKIKISGKYIDTSLEETPLTVVLYDNAGNNQMHVDLKNIQTGEFPVSQFKKALVGCDIAALCNINFSRPFLNIAKSSGKIVATDVHAISEVNDDYNKEFMSAADILFLSNNGVDRDIRDFVNEIAATYHNRIIIAGLGDKGALLYYRDDKYMEIFPAVRTRPVVNTTGAGDALFAAFLYFYNKSNDPYHALSKAIVFASYKIGVESSSDGFIAEKQLDILPYVII